MIATVLSIDPSSVVEALVVKSLPLSRLVAKGSKQRIRFDPRVGAHTRRNPLHKQKQSHNSMIKLSTATDLDRAYRTYQIYLRRSAVDNNNERLVTQRKKIYDILTSALSTLASVALSNDIDDLDGEHTNSATGFNTGLFKIFSMIMQTPQTLPLPQLPPRISTLI